MESSAETLTRLPIGPWMIDAAARQVDGPTGSTRVEPKAMSVLLELVRAPNEVVGRQQLLERVWGAEMATDDVLSRAISELRRALGDDSRNPRFIVTIRGAGYRLVVPEAVPIPTVVESPIHGRLRSRRLAPLFAALAGAVATLVIVVAVRSAEAGRSPRADEMRVIPLTTRPGQESAPRVSPDGTRIAYAWRDDSTHAQHIFVRLVSGSSDVRVTSGVGDHQLAAWSPDGTQLAVTRTDSGALGIYEVPSLGGGERLVTRVPGPYILGLDWTTDGRHLIYSALDSTTKSFGVTVLERATQRQHRLTSGAPNAFGDVYPVASRDGRQVAFVRFFTEVAADVYIVPVGGGEPRRLTHDERAIGSLSFDSDGHSLLYSANRDGRTSVWRIVPDESDSKPTKVFESSHGITGLASSAAGIVVAESDQDLNLWTQRSQGGGIPRRIIASSRIDALPRYSPDGSRIAFVSDRSGQSEVWVSDSAGGNPVNLTQLGDMRGAPSWSPNGDRIAVEREVRSHSQVWIIDVARAEASRLETRVSDATTPTWSADGQSIYVSARRDGQWQVFSIALGNGDATQITSDGGMAPRAAPDGKSILFVKPYERGLYRHDFVTGAESQITDRLGPGDCTNWDTALAAVYFVERGANGQQSIVELPFTSPRGRTIAANVRVPVGVGGLSVTPDGRTIVYGQTDRRDGDLIMLSRQR